MDEPLTSHRKAGDQGDIRVRSAVFVALGILVGLYGYFFFFGERDEVSRADYAPYKELVGKSETTSPR